MKVHEALRILNFFNEKEDIIFACWDKRFIEETYDTKITDEEWSIIVSHFEKYDWCDINNDLKDMLDDLRKNS